MTTDPNAPSSGLPPTSLGSRLPTATLQVRAQEEDEVPITGFALWIHRVTVLLFVFLCASIGVLLVILPWRPEWTDNRLLLAYPTLREAISSGFVRGVCSGLGVLDIWIGFWEAIHYREGN
ncbi:MAG TPA: hypothetical protein VJQ82_07870 [Terriglobales bacterium]|nr:hypothetical protein [Terriglobales bacterium]